jgi:hypothetical protein
VAVDQYRLKNFKTIVGFGKKKIQNSLDEVTLQKGIRLISQYQLKNKKK